MNDAGSSFLETLDGQSEKRTDYGRINSDEGAKRIRNGLCRPCQDVSILLPSVSERHSFRKLPFINIKITIICQ